MRLSRASLCFVALVLASLTIVHAKQTSTRLTKARCHPHTYLAKVRPGVTTALGELDIGDVNSVNVTNSSNFEDYALPSVDDMMRFFRDIISGHTTTVTTTVSEPAAILIVANGTEHRERVDGEPLLSVDPNDINNPLHAFAPYWGAITDKIETLYGRRYNPITVGTIHDEEMLNTRWAVYDIPSGSLDLHPALLAPLVDADLSWIEGAYGNLTASIEATAAKWNENKEAGLCSLSGTLADIAGSLPTILHRSLWLCIACTIILGIAMPIGVNFLIGDLFVAVCVKIGKHDKATCEQEAAGFVLSMSFVVIIVCGFVLYKICLPASCQQSAKWADHIARVFLGV